MVALFLALADVTSAWVVVVLPVAVAAVVKYHDVIAGLLVLPRAPGHHGGHHARSGPDRPD